MLSFRKIFCVILFFISACGFSPINSNQNSASLTKKISLQEPNTQSEFVFYSHLVNRFGEGRSKYILNYAISTAKKNRASNIDNEVHRIEISGSVTFSLKELESGVELLSDKEELYLSYSNFGSAAAVLNAERTTNRELAVLLADKVADRVSLVIFKDGS
jgi:LPS-assembly lipoprotein